MNLMMFVLYNKKGEVKMKNVFNIFPITLLTILFIVGSSFGQEEVKTNKSEKKCTSECCSSKDVDAKMSDHSVIDKNKDGKIFECPMKCEAGKDVAGECSKCGMKLKEVSIKESEHKMMDHSKMDHSKMNHQEHPNTEKANFTEVDKNNDGKVFTCPMKCESPKDKAGKCSKCGMDLKEISTKHSK